MDDRQGCPAHPPPRARRPAAKSGKSLIPYLILSVAPLCWAGNIVLAREAWRRSSRRSPLPSGAGAWLIINLIPAFASLLSVWLLPESIQLFHATGMGLIAGGMALFYRGKPAFNKA